MLRQLLTSLAISAFLAGPALADPCEAIPERGPLPSYLSSGARFSGDVTYVIDGDSLCVAVGPDPKEWVEVRLADFFSPEAREPGGPPAKRALERMALGKKAACVAGRRTYDRIAARCQIDGRQIGAMMRSAGIAEGGRGRAVPGVSRPPVSNAAAAVATGAFRSCAAARAAGAAPMRRGTRGYNPMLDGDGDGLACEPVPAR
jgi:endonuclease YncB( thermonuclease family)